VGVMIRSFPPHPNPLPCLRRSGFAQAGPRGEGRSFIPPAELGGILAYFDKIFSFIKYRVHLHFAIVTSVAVAVLRQWSIWGTSDGFIGLCSGGGQDLLRSMRYL